MPAWLQTAISVLVTIIASSGFWAYIQKKSDSKSASNRMMLGLGHDKIVYLGMKYIDQGWITRDDYENLNDYLYKPYQALGGNGTCSKIMVEVDKLPIRTTSFKGGEN